MLSYIGNGTLRSDVSDRGERRGEGEGERPRPILLPPPAKSYISFELQKYQHSAFRQPDNCTVVYYYRH
ncbi:hypothetical protein J6590_010948 [Homalodisca vitripennis]|nr:hypothetical protein J6590_010948 [Homalodisca vitripennis]